MALLQSVHGLGARQLRVQPRQLTPVMGPSRFARPARGICRIAAPERLAVDQPAPASDEKFNPNEFANLSYSEQYDRFYNKYHKDGELIPVRLGASLPRTDPDKQAAIPGAKKVLFSSVYATPKTHQIFDREYNSRDMIYVGFMVFVHGLALLAPFTFSWNNLALFMGMYFVSGCLGITLSFHRQLSHKAFKTPKWLEYALAYCGVMAVQGDPIEWVSCHRYHHTACETCLDPHSPYEGFFWSHMGWLLDNKTTQERVWDTSNASEMEAQPYYRWLRDTYVWHVVAQFVALLAIGGLPAMVWGGALRMCWVYHITWFVNSASHVWGYQVYDSGDQSRQNWWVGILAFGEGWHNTHHTFEWSARHGLEWWEIDMTYGMITILEKLGLATNVKLPTEKQKEAKRLKPKAAAA